MFQMDKFYLEQEIPKRDIDESNEPSLNFEYVLKSAQQEVPGTKKDCQDLDDVFEDETANSFVLENPWQLNIHSIIYSCLIQHQRNLEQ